MRRFLSIVPGTLVPGQSTAPYLRRIWDRLEQREIESHDAPSYIDPARPLCSAGGGIGGHRRGRTEPADLFASVGSGCGAPVSMINYELDLYRLTSLFRLYSLSLEVWCATR